MSQVIKHSALDNLIMLGVQKMRKLSITVCLITDLILVVQKMSTVIMHTVLDNLINPPGLRTPHKNTFQKRVVLIAFAKIFVWGGFT